MSRGSHSRFWAAVALEYRFLGLVFAFGGLWAAAYGAYLRFRPEAAAPRDVMYLRPDLPVVVIVGLIIALLLWRARSALISGRPRWARPAGVVMLVITVMASGGTALIGLGIAYVLTPSSARPETSPRSAPSYR